MSLTLTSTGKLLYDHFTSFDTAVWDSSKSSDSVIAIESASILSVRTKTYPTVSCKFARISSKTAFPITLIYEAYVKEYYSGGQELFAGGLIVTPNDSYKPNSELAQFWATKNGSRVTHGRTYKAAQEDTDLTTTLDAYHLLKLTWKSGEVKFYVDGALGATHTTEVPTNNMKAQFLGHSISTTQAGVLIDYVKIYKSTTLTVTSLVAADVVELYDAADVLKATDTVGAGETSAILDISALTFPFTGYFKVYHGAVLWFRYPASGTYADIWGGDEWKTVLPAPVEEVVYSPELGAFFLPVDELVFIL